MRSLLHRLFAGAGMVLTSYGCAAELLDSDELAHASVLLLDVKMPGMSGLELQDLLRQRGMDLPIVFLSGAADLGIAVTAMRNGAADFIEKPFDAASLIERVQQAAARHADRVTVAQRPADPLALARFETLTPREREVLDLLVTGMSSKLIARELGCSFRTIEIHRAQVMRKMAARHLAELVRMSIESLPPRAEEPFRYAYVWAPGRGPLTVRTRCCRHRDLPASCLQATAHLHGYMTPPTVLPSDMPAGTAARPAPEADTLSSGAPGDVIDRAKTPLPELDETGRQARIASLLQTLHDTEQQLEAQSASHPGTAATPAGCRHRLRCEEEQWRHREAKRQTALLNALPAHIAVLDPNGVIVAVNDAWRRFGDENGLRDVNHGIGRNYLDLCDTAPGSGAAVAWAVAAGLRAVLAGKRSSFSIEYRCDSADEERWFMLTATPLEAGSPDGVVVMHIDVGDRARAEQAARRGAELLQAVVDNTPNVVYVKDLEGRYLLCNKALTDFAGRPAEAILGRDDLALYSASEAGPVIDGDRSVLATATVQTSELWLTGVNGRRLFQATRAPYRDAQGEVMGVIGIARDITDDRLAQQALRDNKAMLDMAGRMAKVGAWVLDVSERRLLWSDVVASLHDQPAGYSPPFELGCAAFVPEDRAAVGEAVERCITHGVPYELEGQEISATGRRFWVRSMGEPVRNAEGRIVRIQGAMQDITERKLASLADAEAGATAERHAREHHRRVLHRRPGMALHLHQPRGRPAVGARARARCSGA
ncbi:MAG: PAS domain-containing protein [Comamonadaceae bacterium]|nr:PAS domain-containing protein [Comamonadaceae bacterium]